MLLSVHARMPMSMAAPARRAWLCLLGMMAILACASTRVDAADPVITSATAAVATVGQAFTYQITGTNTPTAYSATNLPTGLSVDATGLISGTPTSMTPANPGIFPLTIQAGNGGGTASATVTITETLPPGVIATVSPTLTGPYAVALDAAGDLVIGDTGANCVREETPSGTMSVVAGTPGTSGSGGDGASATAAALNQPLALAFDAAGNLYISDSSNARVRMVSASDGDITTFATGFAIPTGGLGFDGAGNLYVADQSNYRVCRVSSAGAVTTMAGNGSFLDNGDGGPATAAAVGEPFGLCVDGAGNVYFGDTYNRVVREIDTGGIIHTVQGAGGTTAEGLAIDAAGDLYIADTLNSLIRVVSPSGIAGVVAGTGGFDDSGDGGSATAATLYQPIGIALGNRTLLIADPMSNRIRMVALPTPPTISSAAATTAYVGTGFTYQITASGSPFAYDVTGLPAGLTYDATTGAITGTPTTGGTATVSVAATNTGGTGSAQTLTITVIPPPVISSASTATMTVGTPFTYQIVGTNSPTAYAATSLPTGLSVDATGMISGTPASITAANPGTFPLTIQAGNGSGTGSATVTITETLPAGDIAVVAGNGNSGFAGDGGAPWQGKIDFTHGVARDTAGNLYIADYLNNCVRKVSLSGIITTVAGMGSIPGNTGDGGSATAATLTFPYGVAVDAAGNIYISDVGNNNVRKVSAAHGTISTLASVFSYPELIACDGAGTVYVPDEPNNQIFAISSTGAVTAVAGLSGNAGSSGDGGPATAAAIGNPYAVCCDAAGDLYISDFFNHNVRKVDAGGIIHTVLTGIAQPFGLAADAAGDLYFANSLSAQVLVRSPSGLVGVVAGNGSNSGPLGDGGNALQASVQYPFGLTLGQGTVTFSDPYVYEVRTVALPTAPAITSAATAAAQVGQAFTFQLTASGTPFAYDVTGLPAGLTYDATTGAITGTPTTSGTVAASVAATNAGGTGTYDALTFTVLPAAPVITSASSAIGQQGQTFTYQITASSSPTSFSASGLPTGVSVNATSGAVTGIPTGSGSFSATVAATNAGGTGAQALAIVIAPPPAVIAGATVATMTVGQPFTYQVSATYATAFSASDLPTGLSMSATGLISGTPTSMTLANPGVFPMTVSAGNSTATASMTVTVTESMPAGLIANVAGLAGGGADAGDGSAAWAATFGTPFAVAFDAAGDLYIADNNGQCVRRVTPAGIITTVAGTPGHGGDGGDGGSATAATLFDPDGLAVDGAGNLYIADGYYGDIRVVDAATGIITTLASGLNYPQGLAFDGAGNLYVANNADDTVCTVSSTGALTTVAGMSGDVGDDGDSGPATAAAIGQPGMIAFDNAGNLYICDTANNVVRKVDPTGIITTVAGDGGSANFVNGVPATAASVYFPGGIAIDAAGDVYLTETFQAWITVVSPSGVIGLVAGTGTTGATGDGGSATAATMNDPRGMVVGQSMLIFADASNSAVRVIALPSPPVIDSVTVATAQVGQPFAFQPTAVSVDGVAPFAFDITGLPDGLTCNAITGAISGTPTTSGTVAASVAATNTGGTGAYQTLTIAVLPPAPVITSATSASAVVGAAFTYQITANNSPTSFSASGLPDGVSVDATTGAVTGIPTTAGTFNATVIATNAGGSGSAPLAFTIVLPPIPVITSATGATVVDIVIGQGVSDQITASGAATYAATNLPPGLTIDPNSGIISGIPTSAGTYQVTITATNAGGTGSVTFTVNVLPLAPVITSLGIASARIGAAFTYQITATNDPTSFGASGLPPGLTIDPVAGTITGAATATGTYPATMTATNAGGFDTEALVISILPPVSANGPVITSATTASGQVGLQFGYQIIATDNPTLFGAANLPAGLTLNANTGAIIGTPTTAGTFTVTIAAINTDGTGIQTLVITIAPAGMVLTSAPVVVGQAGHGLIYQITATGNPTSFGASNLPPGLVIDTATGIITGVPQQPGSWTATITATGPLGTLSGPVNFYIADAGSDSKCGLGSGLGALLMAMMLLRWRRRRG
jgi:sugar lactone lactonase YvrE/PKD repeat protein